MTEETPPSSLVVRQQRAARPIERGSAWTLRTSRARWHSIGPVSWPRALSVVIGGWAFMAWNRFGFQGVAEPRVFVRFVLVGIYAWIGLAAVLWVGHRVTGRRSSAGLPSGVDPGRLMRVVGLAHQPVLVVGIVLQIGQAVRMPGAVGAVIVVAFVVWMLAVLVAAFGSVVGGAAAFALRLTGVAYLAWLATAGRFLFDQLQHLI